MTRPTAPRTRARGHPTPPVELERLYTTSEAAEGLNISPRFITRLVLERRIRSVKVGRLVRIPHS
ncbi:MAG TPA: helix-turn-helix domain-containing protein, partial [Acidimicrobiales bacterium]|nr:helix-turn-helix domain-containing protein [Acidimicrobiales bacterium]